MAATLLARARDAFAPYSGLVTLAGIAMIIVFGSGYVRHRGALDGASPATSISATVLDARQYTCVKTAQTRLQTFHVKQRCLQVEVETAPALGDGGTQWITVEENSTGTVARGDHVYLVASLSGVDGYLIINAQDRLGFFLRQYAAAGGALLGALLIAVSFFIKSRARLSAEGAASSAGANAFSDR